MFCVWAEIQFGFCPSVFGQKSNLTFVQNFVGFEKCLQSYINNRTEYFPQVAIDTYASVVVWLIFVSLFKYWCY